MSRAERDIRLLGDSSPQGEAEVIARKFGLDPAHPLVMAHIRALNEVDDKQTKIDILETELDKARHDPLTGFLLAGPGMDRLGEMISMVENNLAGQEDDDAPNAIFAIGMDTEALHLTNNYYSHKAGDARIAFDARRLVEAANVVRESVRSGERRVLGGPVKGQEKRVNTEAGKDRRTFSGRDILIRMGGDEFMAAMAVKLGSEANGEALARAVIARLTARREQNLPASRILVRAGFYIPGQTAEDLKHAVDPKAHLSRRVKAARPLSKVIRLALGQYRPPVNENQEI